MDYWWKYWWIPPTLSKAAKPGKLSKDASHFAEIALDRIDTGYPRRSLDTAPGWVYTPKMEPRSDKYLRMFKREEWSVFPSCLNIGTRMHEKACSCLGSLSISREKKIDVEYFILSYFIVKVATHFITAEKKKFKHAMLQLCSQCTTPRSSQNAETQTGTKA